METEAPNAPPSNRPRSWLLVLLGIVLVVALVMAMRDSAGPAAPASNPGRRPQAAAGGDQLGAPDVKLEALKQPAPEPGDSERNPFRFRPKPPPPPPPSQKPSPPSSQAPLPEVESGPRPPPPPPPIPLKFIGVTEAAGIGKIAALSDCRHTVQGVEGDVIDGRYKIVSIGVESLIIEYLDGKGRTTLRMSGQDCVSK